MRYHHHTVGQEMVRVPIKVGEGASLVLKHAENSASGGSAKVKTDGDCAI